MADKHPYMSGAAGLVQTIAQLRRSFPAQVTAETLKKLAIAPNNETYVLNILRFINVLDADNNKNTGASSIFNKHDDSEFQTGFSELVQTAYSDLFGLHSDSAWSLQTDKLISFFRNTDHTSDIVGRRQAQTFQALAMLSGKDTSRTTSTSKPKKSDSPTIKTAKSKTSTKSSAVIKEEPIVIANSNPSSSHMALTVRVEINLPAGGDQETYDRIFKSIKENLLNGNVS